MKIKITTNKSIDKVLKEVNTLLIKAQKLGLVRSAKESLEDFTDEAPFEFELDDSQILNKEELNKLFKKEFHNSYSKLFGLNTEKTLVYINPSTKRLNTVKFTGSVKDAIIKENESKKISIKDYEIVESTSVEDIESVKNKLKSKLENLKEIPKNIEKSVDDALEPLEETGRIFSEVIDPIVIDLIKLATKEVVHGVTPESANSIRSLVSTYEKKYGERAEFDLDLNDSLLIIVNTTNGEDAEQKLLNKGIVPYREGNTLYLLASKSEEKLLLNKLSDYNNYSSTKLSSSLVSKLTSYRCNERSKSFCDNLDSSEELSHYSKLFLTASSELLHLGKLLESNASEEELDKCISDLKECIEESSKVFARYQRIKHPARKRRIKTKAERKNNLKHEIKFYKDKLKKVRGKDRLKVKSKLNLSKLKLKDLKGSFFDESDELRLKTLSKNMFHKYLRKDGLLKYEPTKDNALLVYGNVRDFKDLTTKGQKSIRGFLAKLPRWDANYGLQINSNGIVSFRFKNCSHLGEGTLVYE